MPWTFSPDGTRLVSGGQDSAARIWDVATGRPRGEPIKHRSWVEAVAITPDGRMAASAGQDSLIRIWDPSTSKSWPKSRRTSTGSGVSRSSPDGATAITSAWDDTIRFWDATTGRQQRVIRIAGWPRTAWRSSPDGRVLAASAGRPGEVRLLDPDSGRELRRLHGPHARELRVAGVLSRWQSDHRGRRRGSDRAALGRGHGSILVDFQTRGDGPQVAAISRTAPSIAGAGQDRNMGGAGNVIRIWDAATGGQIRELRGHKGYCDRAWPSRPTASSSRPGDSRAARDSRPAAAPSARPTSATRSISGTWPPGPTSASSLASRPRSGAIAGSVNALAFTPDGRTLISGEENGSIVLYDASNAAVRATLRGHLNSVRAVCVSTNGRRLVSASTDLTALVWDLRRPRAPTDSSRSTSRRQKGQVSIANGDSEYAGRDGRSNVSEHPAWETRDG